MADDSAPLHEGPPPAPHGRGAGINPAGRFEPFAIEREAWDDDDAHPATRLFRDASRSIISTNDSPDIGFDQSINVYRGCEHGCIYCYARPTHEFLGLSAGIDFETKIFLKPDAPALLRAALLHPRYQPRLIMMSGVTDPYQPAERRLELTRGCLGVLAEFGHPVSIITKSHLVTRDADLLARLAAINATHVTLSITTLDPELARAMEPRASTPTRRLEAISRLSEAGVSVGVNVAPVVPGLTEHEMPSILEAAVAAGARFAGYTVLRLPYGVKDLFLDWLDRHAPDRKGKVLSRVRELRDGKLNEPAFGLRMKGQGIFGEQISRMFRVTTRRLGVERSWPELSCEGFRRPASTGDQGELFTPLR